MRSLPSLADHTLAVVRPQYLKFHYEIRFGDEIVGSLAFPKAMSRTCELACAEGRWTIGPAGALKSEFIVKSAPDGDQAAIYHPRVWSGKNELRFPDGRIFFIKSNAWKTRTCASSSDGLEMIRFETHGVFHQEYSLTMNRTHTRTKDFSLILLLTLYVHVSSTKQSS